MFESKDIVKLLRDIQRERWVGERQRRHDPLLLRLKVTCAALEGRQWNQGAFDDGYSARYVHDSPLSACPSLEVSGAAYVESWAAGWMEANKAKTGEYFSSARSERGEETR